MRGQGGVAYVTIVSTSVATAMSSVATATPRIGLSHRAAPRPCSRAHAASRRCCAGLAGRPESRPRQTPCPTPPFLELLEAGVFAIWPRSGCCVVLPRPSLAWEAGQIHRWDGEPAVRWPFGSSTYLWRGVHMTARAAAARERVTARRIASWRNSERQRVAIERVGYERFLEQARAELIAEDDYGKLWRTDIRVDTEPLVIVEVANSTPERDGSRRRYFLRVPPRARTPREAVAWTFGFEQAHDYILAAET